MSFRLRTIFTIVLSSLIVVLTTVLSVVIGRESSREIEGTIGSSLAEVSYQMAEKLDYFMWSRAGEVQMLSKLDTFREAKSPSDMRRLLDELKKSFPVFTWAGFTDPQGKVLASTDGILTGADVSERPVYKNALQRTFIGDVHDAKLLAKLIPNPSNEPLQFVDISTPVYGADGKLVGVLAAHLSWEWSREVEKSILSPLKNRLEGLSIIVVSKKDNTVILGPKDMLGQPIKSDSVTTAQSGQNHWKTERYADGKSYLTGYAYGKGYLSYPGLGWTILIRQPIDVAFASADHLRTTIIVTGIIAAAVFAILGWFIAGWIARPLNVIAKAADRLRKGEAAEIPHYRRIHDLEVLSSSLRNLVADLTKTENKLGEMSVLAMHDKLTGLPNRTALSDYLSKALREITGRSSTLTILYLDLDGFKAINDTLGHQAGDVLLQKVAQRLKDIVREDELVCRMGGDEFVIVLCTSLQKPMVEAKAVTDRIIKSINEPFVIEGQSVNIGCSIGAALYPLDSPDPVEVLNQADEALYLSKGAGKNCATFISSSINKIS
ncbi:diguanylate cyclase [Paenibacillus sp. YPG26]|uniref:sensor domain-containing diguanylate cyclase n=1 Tax=Paenibacillus sp. YPG26 TaxID=2878915 RepID=UPI00203CCB5F|nr:diguanylate cyclase [Paenibacillus sp. YPG26]USB32349.1 diguanylate cyclase [Paenibacillus sp. YPG26]